MDREVNQSEKIIKGRWKYLFVLDACRYDYFEMICGMKGELKRAHSPAFKGKGAPTSVWYRNIFQSRFDDVIHISSHPRVNSKMEVEGFNGSEHFHRVIDLWDTEWDERFGTVLPEAVTKRAREVIEDSPDKRFIIHYMQPHTPYLSLDPPAVKKKREPGSRESISRRIRNKTVSIARKIIGDKRAVGLMDILGLPPLSPMDDALRKVGKKGVKKAYRKNVERVMGCVKDLSRDLNGVKVITSDHGELLGERGRFGHDFDEMPELALVPWFEIKEGRSI